MSSRRYVIVAQITGHFTVVFKASTWEKIAFAKLNGDSLLFDIQGTQQDSKRERESAGKKDDSQNDCQTQVKASLL